MLSSTSTSNNKEPLRLLVDQRRIYMHESLGSVMMRGEVIVNFSKDTMIIGPIQLTFEGIQRFHTWSGIVDTMPEGEKIETKLQVVELSVLPPNSNGMFPAGVHRFPFEFPIPSNLPPTTFIKDRLEIFYQIKASLTKSAQTTPDQRSSWIARVRHTGTNKKLIACTLIRVIRTLESVSIGNVDNTNNAIEPTNINEGDSSFSSSLVPSSVSTEEENMNTVQTASTSSTLTNNTLSDTPFPWDRRNLNYYHASLDEQIDQLAFSLAGRSADNFNASEGALNQVHGIRYKIGVDRTAMVLGTSAGIEMMIEPTVFDARILSTKVDIVESREYTMKIPSKNGSNETQKYYKEGVKMILKWGFGYPIQVDEKVLESEKKLYKKNGKLTDRFDRYVHLRPENREHLNYFDSMTPGVQTQKASVSFDTSKSNSCTMKKVLEADERGGQTSLSEGSLYAPINLKTMDQTVKVGEYFGGRFVMPIPDCYSIMNPSMTHDSIKISHWLRLIVTVACNGEVFDISLETPMHMLNCRLVTFGDETILPPPPSYDPTTSNQLDLSWSGTFWEQRERIASEIGFGACYPCPCELRKGKNTHLPIYSKQTPPSFMKKPTITPTPSVTPSTLLPEWGPPPSYSEV